MKHKETKPAPVASLQQYLDITQTLMVALDAEGRVAMLNRAGCELLGYAKDDEVLGCNWFETCLPQPEGKELVLPVFRSIMAGELPAFESFENEVMCRDGTRRLIRWHNTEMRNETGRIVGTLSSGEDITERKRVEEELRVSEERFRTLFQYAPVMIDCFDGAGRCVLWNEKCRQVFGWTMEELNRHEDPLSLFYPDPAVRDMVMRTVTSEPEGRFSEFHPVTRDGRELVAMWANFSIAGGTVINVGYDITERKQAEEAMRLSESRFRNAFEHSAIGMALVSPEGKWLKVNKQVCDIVGYAEDELMRKTFQDITHPEDLDADLDFVRRMLAGEIETYQMEKRYFHKDGHNVWVLLAVSLVWDERGAPLHFISQIMDITERKRAEEELRGMGERLRLANKATNDVIWDWDIIQDTQRWNEAGTAVFGWTEIVERPVNAHWWVERVHPDDRERVHDSFFAVVNNPELDVWHDEYRFRKADGTDADVLDRGYVLRDDQGKAIRMIGAMQDITERKRVEVELLQLKKSESLGRMAGAVAHHYNNLMGAVLGNLELAADPATVPAKADQLIAEARSSANRAADISRLMLAYLGQSVGTRKPLDLAAVCRQAQNAIQTRLPGNVSLETALLAPPGPAVKADAAQMRQVMDALLNNAAEALGETGGAITVTVGESPASDLPAGCMAPSDWHPTAGRYAWLSVADMGPGMAPETLEKAFDPFFSTKFAGRGLGLPVVLGIVKAHGGAVFVESRPGAGATIRVLLPLSDELPPETSAKPVGVPAAPVAGWGLVLVVDDEPALRSLAQTILRSLGFEAVIAPNGAEAVEIFRQRPKEIRCVLCDLTMPGMSGWETLEALRRIRADVPVVLCSGYDEAGVMADTRADLPQAFLGKPYGKKALSDALAKALG